MRSPRLFRNHRSRLARTSDDDRESHFDRSCSFHRQHSPDRQYHCRSPQLTMPLVLASASPRRQELLKDAGVEFVVKPANIPEVPQSGEPPQAFAERMAREKAQQFLLEPIKRSTS